MGKLVDMHFYLALTESSSGGHNFHKLTVGSVAHQMDRFQILGRQIKDMEVALQRYLLVL